MSKPLIGPLFRLWRLVWVILCVVALILFDNVSLEEVFTSTLLALAVIGSGAAAALLAIFLSRPSAHFQYIGQPVAGASGLLIHGNEKITVPLPPAPLIRLPNGSSVSFEDLPPKERVAKVIPNDLKGALLPVLNGSYGEALRRIIGLMLVSPKTPAATVPGGHRNATLLEHSWNVCREMILLCPNYTYEGMRNKSGDISYGIIDQEQYPQGYRFAEDDPLPLLAAVAHDIGKLVCYAPPTRSKSQWSEILPEHDTEGARLLRALRIYEVMDKHDADRLTIAVNYYHKIESLTTSEWVDDRARALITLLYAADVQTGKEEGLGKYDWAIELSSECKSGATATQNPPQPQDSVTDEAAWLAEEVKAITEDGEDDEAGGGGEEAKENEPHAPPQDGREPQTPSDDASTLLEEPKQGFIENPIYRRGLIVEYACAVEKEMKRIGCEGAGLRELLSCLEGQISKEQRHAFIKLGWLRNTFAHADQEQTAPGVDDIHKARRLALKAIKTLQQLTFTLNKPPPEQIPSTDPLEHLSDEEVMDIAAYALTMLSKTINKAGSCVYKFQSWLFIYEKSFARCVWETLDARRKDGLVLAERYFVPADYGDHTAFTRRLMKVLAKRGALLQEWEGNHYGDQSAYFWVLPGKNKAKDEQREGAAQRSAHVIIARAFAFGEHFFNLSNALYEPCIQGATYQPLRDPAMIEEIKAKMAAWQDPPSKQDLQAQKVERALKSAIDNGYLQKKMPFTASLAGSLSSVDGVPAIRRDDSYGAIFLVEAVLKSFDPPETPHKIVSVDGKDYYALTAKR